MSIHSNLSGKLTRLTIISFLIFLTVSVHHIFIVPVFAKDMIMVTPRAPDSIEGKWFTLIYTEAFSRLGWRFVYEHYPSKRCALLSNAGKVDGEMERVVTFNTAYPNLIRVEERLQTLNLSVYSTDHSLELNGWDSLKDKNFLVSYRRGVKLCEEKLPTVINLSALDDVTTAEQGLKKLIVNYINLYVDFESVVRQTIVDKKLVSAPIYQVGNLEQIPTHPFLHVKHQNHVTDLAKVLKDMKRDGLFGAYWQQARK